MRTIVIVILAVFSLLACAHLQVASTPTPVILATSTIPVFTPDAWIEVVLEKQVAILWKNGDILAELPISSGIGDSPATTTYTGEFQVKSMYRGPEQTVPGVYVKDVVIFDWEHGNGFHSLPMDENGHILDPTIGSPATAGCIRVKDSSTLYEFASVGMKVVIR